MFEKKAAVRLTTPERSRPEGGKVSFECEDSGSAH